MSYYSECAWKSFLLFLLLLLIINNGNFLIFSILFLDLVSYKTLSYKKLSVIECTITWILNDGGGAQWILFLETTSIYLESKWRDHINTRWPFFRRFLRSLSWSVIVKWPDPPPKLKKKIVLKCILGNFQCFEPMSFITGNSVDLNLPPPS